MGSSSKRKSSKRKSSKLSSQARRKKRSRRTKSKKLRRHDDSSSDSSDDSRSSASILASSSEDEYRRSHSSRRNELKGSGWKRTRRSSSSPGSSEENSRHVKKRKGLKKSAKSDSKKKSRKKKRKREPFVSSISSDSRSCSSCSTNGDSEFERPTAKSRGKSKEKRNLGKAKSRSKSDKNMSRSCSPCRGYSDSVDHNSKDILPVENNVRRLRSVITVVKSSEQEKEEWEKDGHKEEIACDHDDYPSCRSNDSNEGGGKREIVSLGLESKRVQNVNGEEALISDIKDTKNQKTGVQDSRSNSISDAAGTNNYSVETEGEDFPAISGASGDDLESILRLKALENLKKYRGVRLQTNAKPPADEKTKSDSEVKRLSTAKTEFVQNSPSNSEDPRIVGGTRLVGQNPRSKMGRGSSFSSTSYGKGQEGEGIITAQNPRSKMGRDSSFSSTSYGKGQEGEGIITERGSARHRVIGLPNKVAISGNSKKEEPSSASEFELGKSGLGQEVSDTILTQTPKANKFVTGDDAEKSSVETSNTVGPTGFIQDGDVGESSTPQPSSSLKPTLDEQIPKDQQGGQFEQKTMSVMRGGEMVEVSYKVYIPKKAPALARRHLRR